MDGLTGESLFGMASAHGQIDNGRSHESCTPIEAPIVTKQAVGALFFFWGLTNSDTPMLEGWQQRISSSKVSSDAGNDSRIIKCKGTQIFSKQ